MSLINQMLKDLEKRKAEGAGGETLPKTVHVVEPIPARKQSLVLGVLLGTVVTGAVGGGAWWYLHRVSTPALPTPSAAVAIAPQPVPVTPLQPEPTVQPVLEAQAPPVAVSAPSASQLASPETDVPSPSARPEPALSGSREGMALKKPQRPRKRLVKTGPRYARPAESIEDLRTTGGDAEDHYQRALRLQDAGDELRAQDELEAALKTSPGHRDARRTLARSYAASGQYRRAETVLDAADRDPEAARLKAQIYLKQGKTEQAEKALQPAADSEDDPDQLAVTGALRQKQGRYDEATALYGKALRAQPGQSKWWLGLAVSLEGRERYDEAVAAYRRVLSVGAPSRDVARYVQSRIEALQGGH